MSILLLGIVTKTELYFLEKDKQKTASSHVQKIEIMMNIHPPRGDAEHIQ